MDLLLEGAEKLKLDLTSLQRERLERYISEIELFNPIYKLVMTNNVIYILLSLHIYFSMLNSKLESKKYIIIILIYIILWRR